MARKRAAPFRLRFYGDDALRMLICVAIGFLLILAQGDIRFLSLDTLLLLIALLSGVASAAFVVSWLLSVRSGAYMMVEVFLLIGAIVPIVLCRIFYPSRSPCGRSLPFLFFLLPFILCAPTTYP